MTAYWIARAKILDEAQYKKYTDCIPDIMANFGGKILTRGARHETLEGPDHFERFVVIEFETMDAAKRCFESQEYRDAAAHRRLGAGENELTVAESGDRTG